MLLGPQRVRIAETGALMLESIEKTAAVLEKAGLAGSSRSSMRLPSRRGSWGSSIGWCERSITVSL